jgi:3'-5' exoribonuclease 1
MCSSSVNFHRHEIIEFPAVLVSTELQQVVDHFQAYCRPVLNPTLSGFCMELTGITQEEVDVADTFPQVLSDFEAWLTKHQLGTKHKFIVVTDGPWDMGRFLYGQCKVLLNYESWRSGFDTV